MNQTPARSRTFIYTRNSLLCIGLVLILHVAFPATTALLYRTTAAGIAQVLYSFDIRTGLLSRSLGLTAGEAHALHTRALPVPSRIDDAESNQHGCFATEYCAASTFAKGFA